MLQYVVKLTIACGGLFLLFGLPSIIGKDKEKYSGLQPHIAWAALLSLPFYFTMPGEEVFDSLVVAIIELILIFVCVYLLLWTHNIMEHY